MIKYLRNNFFYLLIFSSLLFTAPLMGQAATLFTSPKTGDFQIGQTFDLEVRVNSGEQGFNAAQATIQFPKDILEVKSVNFSSSASVFNFWLTEPTFSNQDGKVNFIGGTTSGVVGASIQIFKITFVAKGSGDANITISDAAVTASDGSGTNILSAIETSRFAVNPSITAPPPHNSGHQAAFSGRKSTS